MQIGSFDNKPCIPHCGHEQGEDGPRPKWRLNVKTNDSPHTPGGYEWAVWGEQEAFKRGSGSGWRDQERRPTGLRFLTRFQVVTGVWLLSVVSGGRRARLSYRPNPDVEGRLKGRQWSNSKTESDASRTNPLEKEPGIPAHFTCRDDFQIHPCLHTHLFHEGKQTCTSMLQFLGFIFLKKQINITKK